MKEKVTISTIAKEAGVSKTTISRYINGNYGYMSEATRAEIARIIAKYNYIPSGVARTLKSKKSMMIGIVVNTMRYNVAAKTVTGMQEVCERNGYGTLVCCSNDDPAMEDAAIQMCLNQQVDGLIIIPCRETAEKYLELYNSGLPVVLCTRKMDTWPYGCVYVKHDLLIQKMLEHLLQQGFEKVRFLLDVDTFHKRWMGASFSECAEQYFGMSPQESVVLVGRDESRVHAALDDFLAAYPGKRKAVMAVNTHTLFLTLDYLMSRGVVFPNDIGVCGYDALGWSKLVEPGVSAIKQPMYDMGLAAGEQIMACLHDRPEGRQAAALMGEIFFRDSTCLRK